MELEKFSAQADSNLLKEIRALAGKDGTKLYALINEAFEDLLDKRNQEKPRKDVITHFEESIKEYDYLYDKLSR